ncbi:hypothetical protein D3C78_1536550 [compost metagenome]
MRRHLVVVQLSINSFNLSMCVDGTEFETGRFNFRHTDARVAVQDLALQVRE